MEILVIDSESLSMTFHSYGINLRYLGLVAQLSNVNYVKDLCINEMVARSAKNLLK